MKENRTSEGKTGREGWERESLSEREIVSSSTLPQMEHASPSATMFAIYIWSWVFLAFFVLVMRASVRAKQEKADGQSGPNFYTGLSTEVQIERYVKA